MITRRGINYYDDKVLGEAEATSMHAAPVLKSRDGLRMGDVEEETASVSITVYMERAPVQRD